MTLDYSDLETGLTNPYSKITCFVLYLYSMESGTPPLYEDLNRVTRAKNSNKDEPKPEEPEYLMELGPFSQVLSKILSIAENNRDELDKVETGQMISSKSKYIGHIAGIFFLFRGVKMPQNVID